MKKFESDINDCYYLPIAHVMIMLFLILFKLIPFNGLLLLLCIPYLFIWYVILSYADNTVSITETSIIIEKSNLIFKKKEVINKDEIDNIRLEFNWTDDVFEFLPHKILIPLAVIIYKILPYIFPAFFKFIVVYYKDGRVKRFYCFGIEEDHYTNADNNTFENLVRELYKLNYKLKMTKKVTWLVRK